MNPLKILFSIMPQKKTFYGTIASKSNGRVVVSLITGGTITIPGTTELAENSKCWVIKNTDGSYSIQSAPEFDYYELAV